MSLGLKYRLILIFMLYTDTVDMTRYDREDTNIAEMTSQNCQYFRIRYQKSTLDTDTHIEISNLEIGIGWYSKLCLKIILLKSLFFKPLKFFHLISLFSFQILELATLSLSLSHTHTRAHAYTQTQLNPLFSVLYTFLPPYLSVSCRSPTKTEIRLERIASSSPTSLNR